MVNSNDNIVQAIFISGKPSEVTRSILKNYLKTQRSNTNFRALLTYHNNHNKMCFCVKQLLLRLKSCSRFLKKKRYTLVKILKKEEYVGYLQKNEHNVSGFLQCSYYTAFCPKAACEMSR